MFSKLSQVKLSLDPFAVTIAQNVEQFIRVAVYKCDRPSVENAFECLAKLVLEYPQAKMYAFNSMISILADVVSYMSTSESMAKIYILQVLQSVLSTSS